MPQHGLETLDAGALGGNSILPALPLLTDAGGIAHVDLRAVGHLPATTENAASLILVEAEALQLELTGAQSDSELSRVGGRITRLTAAQDAMLGLVSTGRVRTVSEVYDLVDLVQDGAERVDGRGPKHLDMKLVRAVYEQHEDAGDTVTVAEIAVLLEAADALRVPITVVDRLFTLTGLEPDDEESLELLSTIVESLRREVGTDQTLDELVQELFESGATIADLVDN